MRVNEESAETTTPLAKAGSRHTVLVASHPESDNSTLIEALLSAARETTKTSTPQTHEARPSPGQRAVAGTFHGPSDASVEYQRHGIHFVDAAAQLHPEATTRNIANVDMAIMVVDAARGAETLTASLYEACRARGIPVLTLIDKWDRPGKEPLRLLNEIRELARMTPAPLNWPVGPAGHMRAMIDLREADRVDDHQYGGATADLGRVAAARIYGNDWEIALAGVTALEGGHRQHRRPEFPALDATPVIFGSVLHGVGLTEVLDLIIDLTPGSRAESALTRQGFSDSEAARSPAS